jgi:hypothetical protein
MKFPAGSATIARPCQGVTASTVCQVDWARVEVKGANSRRAPYAKDKLVFMDFPNESLFVWFAVTADIFGADEQIFQGK